MGPSIEITRRLTEIGIPVMGHLGLTPQSVHAMGGFKVQGKTDAQAARIMADARALEEAGAFSLVLEGVPSALATDVTKALRIPTIGIGAGPGADAQVLVFHDAFGLTTGKAPKFVKRYANLAEEISRAATRYAEDVRTGAFSGPEHEYSANGQGASKERSHYPRDFERDVRMLAAAEVDAIYRPSAEVMYPAGAATRVRVAGVAEPLEGAARPGHFEGIATVVTKLFTAVAPDRAYFGQKDAQQVAVIRRLVADLDLGIEIRVVPTVREPDGLALSSRNGYLDPAERKAPVALSVALRTAAGACGRGEREPGRLRELMVARLAAEPLVRLEYAELVDPATFRPPGHLAVLAAWVGKTRLIDNHDLAEPFDLR